MRLTDREARILAGEAGEAPSLALEQQIAVGEFFDAEHFVPITNAHMMGDMEVMGDAGFAFVESLVKHGAAFAVPVTTNARCVDFERAAAVRQDPALVAREAALVAHLKKLCALNDYADWGALGGIIGRRTLDYWKVPVLAGVRHAPAGDELKHFGAALASYGSCAMYHMIGVTPEARDEAEAFRGAAPEAAHVVDDAALAAFYRTYPEDRPEIDVVVFSGPQLSVLELRRIAALLDGRRVHANTALLVTTNFANREMAARLGYVKAIEDARGRVLSGVCWYIMEPAKMAAAFGWKNVLTNSAKIANIIGGYRLHPILRTTDVCVEAAVSGRLPARACLA